MLLNCRFVVIAIHANNSSSLRRELISPRQFDLSDGFRSLDIVKKSPHNLVRYFASLKAHSMCDGFLQVIPVKARISPEDRIGIEVEQSLTKPFLQFLHGERLHFSAELAHKFEDLVWRNRR